MRPSRNAGEAWFREREAELLRGTEALPDGRRRARRRDLHVPGEPGGRPESRAARSSSTSRSRSSPPGSGRRRRTGRSSGRSRRPARSMTRASLPIDFADRILPLQGDEGVDAVVERIVGALERSERAAERAPGRALPPHLRSPLERRGALGGPGPRPAQEARPRRLPRRLRRVRRRPEQDPRQDPDAAASRRLDPRQPRQGRRRGRLGRDVQPAGALRGALDRRAALEGEPRVPEAPSVRADPRGRDASPSATARRSTRTPTSSPTGTPR